MKCKSVKAWKRGSVAAFMDALCAHASTNPRIYASALLLLLAGCGIGSERKHPLELRVRDLEREKAELAGEVERCQVANAQLQQQVKAMAALPEDGRENPYQLARIQIAGFTGFYDKDGDGRREKLIVYIQPIDTNTDTVKAAGVVGVQLWNLNDPNDQALLGQWQVQPSELHKLWFSTLISSYRLMFDVPITPELLAQPLTVRVTFTDYLTGQVLHAQHVIEPRSE